MTQKLKQINDISIGDNLRQLRNTTNLTQNQVVAQLQLRNIPISKSIYSQIETGTSNISISELIALSEIFHTDFNTIFNGLTHNKYSQTTSFLLLYINNLYYYSTQSCLFCLFMDFGCFHSFTRFPFSFNRPRTFFFLGQISFCPVFCLQAISSFLYYSTILYTVQYPSINFRTFRFPF